LVTDPRNRMGKNESGWRISFSGKSHQPFRSVYYFLGRAAQDRLDGNGGILSASSARFSFASGRCVPGGSRSCGSQNHPHSYRTAETGPNCRTFSRGGHPRWHPLVTRRRTVASWRVDTGAYRWSSDFAVRDCRQRSIILKEELVAAETNPDLDRVRRSDFRFSRTAKIRRARVR